MYDWEDVVVPNLQSEEWFWDYTRTNFQSISLDYRRFQSESLLACYQLERDEIKKITPEIPVTTNLMGFIKIWIIRNGQSIWIFRPWGE